MRRHLITQAVEDLLSGAECLYDPELHDGPAGVETLEEQAAREHVAKEVCAGCPVLAACEAYTDQTRPKSGVWAGRTPSDRMDLGSLLIGGIPRSGKSFALRWSLPVAGVDDAKDVA
jgi:hypothetical protein